MSFRVRPNGFLAGLSGPRVVHVDIVDYPGEWLLDLALLDKSYTEWSDATLDRIAKRPEASAFMATTRAEDGYRALLESTAFGTRKIVETFQRSGVPVEEFRAQQARTK